MDMWLRLEAKTFLWWIPIGSAAMLCEPNLAIIEQHGEDINALAMVRQLLWTC